MTFRNRILGLGTAGAVTIAMAFIASWEGYSPKPYYDSVKALTVCRGHTGNIDPNLIYTDKQCDQFYESDVGTAVKQVDDAIKVPVSDYELAAYTSFVFNVGIGNFKKSTMLKKLNAGDHIGSCNEFMRWIYVGGKDCRNRLNMCYGIVRRRLAERGLCLTQLNR